MPWADGAVPHEYADIKKLYERWPRGVICQLEYDGYRNVQVHPCKQDRTSIIRQRTMSIVGCSESSSVSRRNQSSQVKVLPAMKQARTLYQLLDRTRVVVFKRVYLAVRRLSSKNLLVTANHPARPRDKKSEGEGKYQETLSVNEFALLGP